jgi:hypothetical protein
VWLIEIDILGETAEAVETIFFGRNRETAETFFGRKQPRSQK